MMMMKNLMMILAEMEHGEISWENPLTTKSDGNLIYSFHSNPHSIISIRMFIVDTPTPIVFIADAPTIFVLVFTTLLFIAWIAIILWVRSIITRDSNHDDPNDVELAI
jgi:hypothetical protein